MKKTGLPRRQILLLLSVLAVPSILLVGLGLRIHQQERQLASRRAEEERGRRVSQFRSDLLSTLERIKLQSLAGRPHEAVVLLAGIREGQLELPFDKDEPGMRFRRSLSDSAFGARIRRAEHEELIAHRFDQAAELFRAAAAGSIEPRARAYANLLLGRTLLKAGRKADSRGVFRTVLGSPSDLRDEFGMPLALYAASSLLEAGGDASEVRSALRGAAGSLSRLGSAALYRMRDLAGEVAASELVPTLDHWIAERRQAEALQAEFSRLAGRLQGDDPVWAPYGEPMWLISLLPRTGSGGPALVAVDAARLAVSKYDKVRIVRGKEGEPLGESFPGLRVVTTPALPPEVTAGIRFLTLALGLIMGLTLLAGYLLWRDVRRSARLAELRSEFVASVSHELRTPLTSIRMYTEILRIDDEMAPEARAGYLDTIHQESQRLSRLVDNVLQFARIEQGRVSYDLRPQSLAGLVENAARTFGGLAAQSGFQIRVECAPDLPPALADRDAIEQAILNLLSNAMKYSGGSRDIAVRLERQDGYGAIQVIDHGIGIAADEQRKIFERFYRAHSDENREIPGTGLGLTLVEHIASAHGGHVTVKSRVGEGSTFTLCIPIAASEEI